jgi:anti-sigma factor ChrR (cupin superfamily)
MTGERNNDLSILLACLGMPDDSSAAEVPGTRPDLADRAQRGDETLGTLASLVPAVEPPEGLFEAIEAEIDALPSTPIETLRADEGEWVKWADQAWKKMLFGDKIWKKILSADSATGKSVYLLRCEAGAIIPAHKHARDEHVFVIEGEFVVDGAVVKAGDSQISRAGSIHPEIRSATGCLVLVHA